jgi:hypothetical protein
MAAVTEMTQLEVKPLVNFYVNLTRGCQISFGTIYQNGVKYTK